MLNFNSVITLDAGSFTVEINVPVSASEPFNGVLYYSGAAWALLPIDASASDGQVFYMTEQGAPAFSSEENIGWL